MDMSIMISDAPSMYYHNLGLLKMHNSENSLLQQDTTNSPTHQDFGGTLQELFSSHWLWMILGLNM